MATGAPGTNGVWQYGEDDSEATFSALLNKAASTTDTQIGADRTRLTALEARKLSALTPVAPSSVDKSGGTASATGARVDFAGVTSVSLNGVFTSTYANYKVILAGGFRGTVSGASVFLQYRASGTNRTTNYYQNGVIQNGSSAPAASTVSNGSAYFFTNVATNSYNNYEMNIYSPSNSGLYTVASCLGYGFQTSTMYLSTVNIHDIVQAQDGFTLTVGSGTITGSATVYGWN